MAQQWASFLLLISLNWNDMITENEEKHAVGEYIHQNTPTVI
jgi:hypothetical protein